MTLNIARALLKKGTISPGIFALDKSGHSQTERHDRDILIK